MPERLQKILARHGLGSRREIERWISEGRVTVNRQPAQIGAHYAPGDRIAIDGKEVTARLHIEAAPQVLLYHKAQGEPITHEARAQRSTEAEEANYAPDTAEAVVDRLPRTRGSRWVPINPMHAGDSGLLLLTNDGNLAYALTRRKRWIPTAYMVRVLAPSDAKGAAREIPEIPLHVSYDTGRGTESVEFTGVEAAGGEGANLWYRVALPRADHRAAVRALFESRDLKVSRMTQVAFGAIELPREVARGRHRALLPEQVAALYELAQLKMPEPPSAPVQPRRARPLAPDRRRAKKQAEHRKGAARRGGDEKFSEQRAEKKVAKHKRAVQQKSSTWKLGGKKRPRTDLRR